MVMSDVKKKNLLKISWLIFTEPQYHNVMIMIRAMELSVSILEAGHLSDE